MPILHPRLLQVFLLPYIFFHHLFSHALYDLLKEDPAFHNIVLDDSEEIPIAAQGAFHLAMKDLQTH